MDIDLTKMRALGERLKSLHTRINCIKHDPVKCSLLTHPLFINYMDNVCPVETTNKNIDEHISKINKLIMVVDGQIDVTELV